MVINGPLKYLMLKEQNATLKSAKKEGYQLFSEYSIFLLERFNLEKKTILGGRVKRCDLW